MGVGGWVIDHSRSMFMAILMGLCNHHRCSEASRVYGRRDVYERGYLYVFSFLLIFEGLLLSVCFVIAMQLTSSQLLSSTMMESFWPQETKEEELSSSRETERRLASHVQVDLYVVCLCYALPLSHSLYVCNLLV